MIIWNSLLTVALIYSLFRIHLNKKQLDSNKEQQEKNTKILKNSEE